MYMCQQLVHVSATAAELHLFLFHSDGSLHLTCTEPSSNATQDVVIDGSWRVTVC